MVVVDQTDVDLVVTGDLTGRNITSHLGSGVDAICCVYLLWGNISHLCKVTLLPITVNKGKHILHETDPQLRYGASSGDITC
jgi:hypothetical protein